MLQDSINDEVREARHELAAEFDNDLQRIAADLRERQASSDRTYVTFRKTAAALRDPHSSATSE